MIRNARAGAENKVTKVFLQLRSYSQYKQEFQRAKSPFARLKPIYSDLAQTFLVIHLQFVSISPISMFHLAPLAPECFLIIWNPYQSSPSLLILFPSGYLLPLLMFFYLTYNSYSVVICSLLQSWLSIFPSWLIVTSIKSNYYPEFIYSPCQSSSLIVILAALAFHCRPALSCLQNLTLHVMIQLLWVATILQL